MKFKNYAAPAFAVFMAACVVNFPGLAETSPAPSADSVKGLEIAHQLNAAFAQIADTVSESVVVITVTQKPSASSNSDTFDEYEDPWEKFRKFFDKNSQDQPRGKPTGQGSGIIIRKNGFILTNRHVVEDAEKVEVRLKDGRTFVGTVHGQDSPADVAVIKIEAEDLPVAKLGDSDKSRIGEFAIAIGAPFSLEYSTTIGHISAKNRSNLGSDSEDAIALEDQEFIQTDASINPGNSGGPLVNIDGEVIGINTLIKGIHTGIGFAIPINQAREIAESMIKDGKFTRSWLGISIKSLRDYPEFKRFLPDTLTSGLVVSEISLKGPAAKSNLRIEDVILAVDGKTVADSQQLHDEIRHKSPGKSVSLDVFRPGSDGGKKLLIPVHAVEWIDPNESDDEANDSDGKAALLDPFGISVKAISPDEARKYGLEMSEGVVISKANKSGVAYQAGLQEGDIVTSIDGRQTKTPRQYHEALLKVDLRKGSVVQFIGSGSRRFEILKSDGD